VLADEVSARIQHVCPGSGAGGQLSAIAFMRGAWTALRRILVPTAWKTAVKEAVKFDPRSRITNLMSRTARRG
jgi:hypothetical protein